MNDHTHQLADSGDRLSKRASVFALLLTRIAITYDSHDPIWCEHCARLTGGHMSRLPHAPNCVITLARQAISANAAELDAIRALLTNGDA